jgi:hypothetical protein
MIKVKNNKSFLYLKLCSSQSSNVNRNMESTLVNEDIQIFENIISKFFLGFSLAFGPYAFQCFNRIVFKCIGNFENITSVSIRKSTSILFDSRQVSNSCRRNSASFEC